MDDLPFCSLDLPGGLVPVQSLPATLRHSFAHLPLLDQLRITQEISTGLVEHAAYDIAQHSEPSHATSVLILLGELSKSLDRACLTIDAAAAEG